MTIALVAGFIILVLVASVVVSSLSHKREQQAAELRQRAAEYRARVQETQELLEGLQNAGLDASIRAALMGRIAENLAGLKQCEPGNANVDSSLRFAREQVASLKAQAGQTSPLILPDNEQGLFNVLKLLRRLLQVYASQNQLGKIDAAEYAQQFPRLKQLLLRFEVEGYMKLGTQAFNMHQQGSARTYFDFAHNRLIASAVTDEYTQQQLVKLQELIDRLDSPGELKPSAPASAPEGGSVESGDEDDDIFRPKKKW